MATLKREKIWSNPFLFLEVSDFKSSVVCVIVFSSRHTCSNTSSLPVGTKPFLGKLLHLST